MMLIKEIIKDFYNTNLPFLLKYKNWNKISKSGISWRDKMKILRQKSRTEGKIELFSKEIHYSDNLGLLHSLDEIFSEEVYRFLSHSDNPFIIDCGSNIGLSIIYFKRLYPKAKILGFEPDQQIFKLLNQNIQNFDYQDIKLYNKAVWIENTVLNFLPEGSLSGKIVDYNSEKCESINAIDLKPFLEKGVDFLKIDIEGAENTLIFDLKPFLKNVDNLFLEYHGIIDNEQNLGEILNVIKSAGFHYYIKLAADNRRFPFLKEEVSCFDQQLNIFCFRK